MQQFFFSFLIIFFQNNAKNVFLTTLALESPRISRPQVAFERPNKTNVHFIIARCVLWNSLMVECVRQPGRTGHYQMQEKNYTFGLRYADIWLGCLSHSNYGTIGYIILALSHYMSSHKRLLYATTRRPMNSPVLNQNRPTIISSWLSHKHLFPQRRKKYSFAGSNATGSVLHTLSLFVHQRTNALTFDKISSSLIATVLILKKKIKTITSPTPLLTPLFIHYPLNMNYPPIGRRRWVTKIHAGKIPSEGCCWTMKICWYRVTWRERNFESRKLVFAV